MGKVLAAVLAAAGVVTAADPPKLGPRDPVALVGGAKGAVTAERGKDKARVMGGGVLHAGDRLTAPADGGLTVVLFADARRLRLKPGKTATLGETGFDPADAAEEVDGPRPDPQTLKVLWESYRAKSPPAGGDAAARVVRGPDEDKEAAKLGRGLTPLHGSRVLSDHPTLGWPGAAGAKEYRVQLFDGGQGDPKSLWTARTAEHRLPYPEDEKVLARGGLYRWRVTTAGGEGKDEVVAEGKFFVASDRQVGGAAKVRRLAEGDDPVGLVVAADTYDAHGMYGKALPLYEKLAEKQPESAEYQVALARYYTLAGREADAKAAAERAKALGAKSGGK